MKNVKTWIQFTLATFTIIVLAMILKSLVDSPTGLSIRQAYSKEAEKLAAENAIKIQQQKDRAVWMRWKSEELKARVASEASLQKIKSLPDKALRWSAFWWGAVVSSTLFMALTSILLAISAYKLSRAHSELIALTVLGLRGRSKEELMAARETMKLEEARLKYLDQHPGLIISAKEPIVLSATPVKAAGECLDLGLISRDDNRFLWGFLPGGEPHFMTLKDKGFKTAIIGTTNQGKTYKIVTLTAQCRYKGFQAIIIDLHWDADRSLYRYMEPFQDDRAIYWCTDRKDVNSTLQRVESELNTRLSGGSKHPLVVVVDDTLAIGNDLEFSDQFTASVVRCVTEGPKVGISIIAASHNWQADSLPKQFRSNFDFRCAYHCDPSESHLLFQDKKYKYANLTQTLKAGECILVDSTNDMFELQGPIWSQQTLARMADMAKLAPALIEEFALPKEFQGLHLIEGGKLA